MKVLITGATGLVGNAILRRCILDTRITSIIVLSRSKLNETLSGDSKVTTILHDDFLSYPDELVDKFRGTQACLWALGLRGNPFGYKDAAYAEDVDVNYPSAAAEAFARALTPVVGSGNLFRFVLCSGRGAELDQSKRLYAMRQTRQLKGRAEVRLQRIAEGTDRFAFYAFRPFGIWPEEPSLFESVVLSILPSVKVDELAAAMVEIAICGSEKSIWENAEIREKGALLCAPLKA